MKIEKYSDTLGSVSVDGSTPFTYEILSQTTRETLNDFISNLQNFTYREAFAYDEYTIAAYGEHNNVPEEMRNVIKNNPLLPEVLKKQVRFMFGQGPWLFTEEIDDSGHLKRKPLPWAEHADVKNWLESWQKNGLENDYITYLKRCIQEYYYTEGIFSKWLFNRSRRTNGRTPVRGLEYIPSTRARLAKTGMLMETERLEWSMVDSVLVSHWDLLYRYKYSRYPLLKPDNPLADAVAVNYVKDEGFGEEIYSYPTFYFGLREWIKGANLNPKYVNSYLKNSLSAKLHVIIPDSWLKQKEDTLREIVEVNQTRDQDSKELITEYDGLKEIGTTFSYSMVQELVDIKLTQLANVMSGEGENQGKFFTSRKFLTEHGVEEWEFKEIPTKYKEFISSIIEYDTRAVEMIVAGKGLPPSISNLTKEGIFAGSGSEAYYNYLIYLNQLTYAEDYIMQDINRALQINFPRLRRENIRLGFYRNIPQRQEDTEPNERIQRTTQS